MRVAGNVLGREGIGSLDYAIEHLRDSLRLLVVLGQGAVAYYPLTENSGSVAADASGDGNNGTISASGVNPGGVAGPLGGGNAYWGVIIQDSPNNTIGGATAGMGNVISGNGQGGVALFGSNATGLVVTYSTSGVFNLAHGSVATMCALVYWQLRFDWHVTTSVALILTVLVFAPILGLFLEVVVIRGLRGTSEVTRLVTPIALLIGVNGAATWIWFRKGSRAIVPKKFFGEKHVEILGQAVFWHQLISVVLAALIAVGLYLVLYHTRAAVTMRATVDDRTLLMLNGGRPNRTSVASWMIGAALAGLAGVLLSPVQGALSDRFGRRPHEFEGPPSKI